MNDLVVDFLVRLGWASVFLSGAAILAQVALRLLRVKSSGAHAATWWVVLLQGLLMFQVTLTVPWYEASAPVVLARSVPVSATPVPLASDSPVDPVPQTASAVSEPAPMVRATEKTGAIPWPILIGALWLGGMVFVLVRSIWRYVAFLRACRSRPCDRRDWTEEWNAVMEEAGVSKPIPIHLGFGVGPALCRHPSGYRLVVPVRLWRRLSSEQRRWVMRHELAHYQRGDVWALLLARLLALPHWFNPFAWYATGAIELASEYACDDFASQSGREATTRYAKTLLAIGEMANRPPAWTTAGGGGCLFKRISRVLSTSQTKDSGMKKTLILVVFLVATLAAVLRVELVAQESPRQAGQSEPAKAADPAETANAVARIRELAKPAPIPFDEIEAIAAGAADSGDPGRIYAEVATIYHEHGSPVRTIAWAQAALRQPLSRLDRLRMLQYWSEAEDRHLREQKSEDGEASLPPLGGQPVLWGLLEASRYRVSVEGYSASCQLEKGDDSLIMEHLDDLVEARDTLVRIAAGENSDLELELKRLLLSNGLAGKTETPSWLAEGRAMACTFRIDYPKLWKDLPPVCDAWVGEPGAFGDIKVGLKEDKNGPQVDLERELIPYLGQRTTLVMDYQKPILRHGERTLFAIEATDPNQVADVVDRLFVKDSNFSQVSEAGAKIWVSEPREGQPTKQGACVAHGYLLCGDLDLLRETLSRAE